MTCICKLQISGGEVQNTHPRGNKHTRFIIFAKLFVCFSENIVYSHTAFSEVLDNSFCCHHKHSRGNSLSRNVCCKECNCCIIKLVEVVEIASDLLCCNHLCIDVVVLIFGEVCGECRELNLFRIFKFFIDASCSLCNITLESGNGRVNIIRQGRKFRV